MKEIIDQIIRTSDKCRRLVGQESISSQLERFINIILSENDNKRNNSITRFRSLMKNSFFTPNDIWLDFVRSISLRNNSMLIQSLESHFNYYKDFLFSHRDHYGFLKINLHYFSDISAERNPNYDDLLFYNILKFELLRENECDFYPLLMNKNIYGWIIDSGRDSNLLEDDQWPKLSNLIPGIVQPLSRNFRHSILNAENQNLRRKNFVILLYSGLQNGNRLYFSDPLQTIENNNLDQLINTAVKINNDLFFDSEEAKIQIVENQSIKPILIRDLNRKDFVKILESLSININTEKLKLIRTVIENKTRDSSLNDKVWIGLSEITGWKNAFYAVYNTNEEWEFSEYLYGDIYSEFEYNVGKVNKVNIQEELKKVFRTRHFIENQSPFIISGGMFKGKGNLLIIPSTYFDQYTQPTYFIIHTHNDLYWITKASKDLLKQIKASVKIKSVSPTVYEIIEKLHENIYLEKYMWPCPGILCTDEKTKYGKEIWNLYNGIKDWKMNPGKDIIIIGGNSGSGKEYVSKKILKKLGYECFKGIASEILNNKYGIIEKVARSISKRNNVALIFDEFPSDDDKGREYCALFQDKKLNKSDLTKCMFLVLSSNKIVNDIITRSKINLKIPDLSTHTMDLPLSICSIAYDCKWKGISKAALVSLSLKSWENMREVGKYIQGIDIIKSTDNILRLSDLSKTDKLILWPILDQYDYKFQSTNIV